MKRKRGSGRRKPKKPQVAGANKASTNSAYLNTEDVTGWGDFENDGFNSIMEVETTHVDATTMDQRAGLQEPAFIGETNGGNLMQNINLLKNVASFAARLSKAVSSSDIEPTDKSLPLQGEKIQGMEPRVPHRGPHYNEQELNTALSVIKKIMKMDAAKPFNVPVDPTALGIPDYFDVIGRPMDFGTICNNLELDRKYRHSKDVYKDVELIWENCSKYNKKGDYILELMKRVKCNFIRNWNAAGLFRQREEVDNETNVQHAAECCTRHNNDGHIHTAGSMVSNSIHQDQPDSISHCQVQRQQYSPGFSHKFQSQPISSPCQCQYHSMDLQSLQSLQPHCSRHLDTARGPISGKYYSQMQDEIRPNQEFSHQSSPRCGTRCHHREARYKYRPSSSHLQTSTMLASRSTPSAGHLDLPIHQVSSSSTYNNCGHACTFGPLHGNANHQKHYQKCSCHIDEHESLLRCSDHCRPQQKTCQYHSNSCEMRNTEPDVRDAGNAVHPRVHMPVESTARYTKGRLGCPIAPVTAGSSQLQQCKMGASQVQSSSMVHNCLYQPQEKSSQCQLDLGLSEPPLPQDRANIDGTEHSCMQPPTESIARRATCRTEYSGSPAADYYSDQQECEMGPSESDSPSLVHSQSDQPKENGPQCRPSAPEPSLPQGEANRCDADSTGLERKTRGRGPTRCLKLLDEEKRIPITTNELGQPVGLEASKLTSFLGTLARNGHLAPLTYVGWRAVPEENKENMWQEVQKRFEIDPTSKSWVIKSLSKKWKDWKAKLKIAHYNKHSTEEERLADRDERVLPDQWAYLVTHWNSEEAEKRSATNKANRAKQKFGHISGTKSFARIREEQRVKRLDGKAPSRAELFILTRTRKDGKPINDASSAVITQLHEFKSQHQDASQKSTDQDDLFSQVVGRDRHGRVRCYGLGPSPSNIGGAKPTQAEAMKMVSEANAEVRQMKERLVAMEQTCTQMAAQMATMMSMMSSMQKNPPDNKMPDVVPNGAGTSQACPEQQAQSASLRRSSRRGKM